MKRNGASGTSSDPDQAIPRGILTCGSFLASWVNKSALCLKSVWSGFLLPEDLTTADRNPFPALSETLSPASNHLLSDPTPPLLLLVSPTLRVSQSLVPKFTQYYFALLPHCVGQNRVPLQRRARPNLWNLWICCYYTQQRGINPADEFKVANHLTWKWEIILETPGIGDGQEGLACCSPWGRKESDMTERLNWTELNTVGLSVITRVLKEEEARRENQRKATWKRLKPTLQTLKVRKVPTSQGKWKRAHKLEKARKWILP